MKKILTASVNNDVIKVVKTVCKAYSQYFKAEIFGDTVPVVSFIKYEIPEIKVLDYSSAPAIDCEEILNEIKGDAWLHYGGIIAVCKNSEQVMELEELKDNNMIAILTVNQFKSNFERILRILQQNQQFLFNRGMQDLIGGQESGKFICGNDPMDIRYYTNFLVSYLYNTNRISAEDRFNLQVSLMEYLTNALEHGNLEISYEEKSRVMAEGKDLVSYMKERSQLPEFADRKIHIEYVIGKSKSLFKIRDDGKGFDWRKFLSDSLPETGELHGRGIAMSRELVQRVSYNEKGNEVSFEIKNLKNKVNTVPGIMEPFGTIEYKDRDIVCRENEISNDLFFIVSGRFAVYKGRKLTAVLTPNDMFIGEMAFLLNDRRTASILAVGDCRLIKISKTAFLTLIRKNPHYGVFLSKMLATRLAKQTKVTMELKAKLESLS
ncbi:MAG: cyclic nucleotide-binding domain-containing protein [Treponema sp.]|nr:cyclic nucleotide-binding domain-containing protein [Treponema sp.]